ncbi:MAG: alpha/beta hydrolase [Planctomycetota bacterium]
MSTPKPFDVSVDRVGSVVGHRVAWTTTASLVLLFLGAIGGPRADTLAATLELSIRPGDTSAESQATLILPHLDEASMRKPAREQVPRVPLVIVLHGGGWFSGDKWMVTAHSERLADAGIAVLNMNYRLAPAHPFPASVDDVRSGLLTVVDHADLWRIDVKRIGLFGYSAGGHLATLVVLLGDEALEVQSRASEWPKADPRWKRLPPVAAVAAGGPYCDFRGLPIDSTLMSYFLGGTRRELPLIYEAASPTAHASMGDPPVQLIHGDKDIIVPIASSLRLRDALKGAGSRCELTVLSGHGHLVTHLHPTTLSKLERFFVGELLNQSILEDLPSQLPNAAPQASQTPQEPNP